MLNQHWVDEELGTDFGDKRLNKRFIVMAKKFDQSPEERIPKVLKILWMTWVGRVEPQKSTTKILSPSEGKVIKRYFHLPADQKLSAGEAIRLIARLGGF